MGLKSSSTRGKGELIIEGPALVSVLLLLKWGGFPLRAQYLIAFQSSSTDRCRRVPIEPDFQKKRKKAGKEEGITIWGPMDPP
jgi:hypothetical protein